jgi:DNA-directed RNA polymerase specialized sigma24 family protein
MRGSIFWLRSGFFQGDGGRRAQEKGGRVEPDGTPKAAEITLLLADGAAADTENVKRGLDLVFRHWARPVLSIVRGIHTPAQLPAEDFQDLWQDTIRDLALRVRGGGLRRDGSLFSLVCTIAKRLAARHVRRRAKRQTVPLIDELEDTRDRRRWADLGPLERAEVLELMQAAIPTLPSKAGTVIEIFIRHFPESASMERLRQMVSAVTGREETLAAVKRGLQDAREGLRNHLRRKGYDFRTGGDR